MRNIPIEKIIVETKQVSKQEAIFQLQYLINNKNFDSAMNIVKTYEITIHELKTLKDTEEFISSFNL